MLEINNKEECSGCHACYSVCPKRAIKMIEDEEGFGYPLVNQQKCVNCHLCEKVCPIINKKVVKNEPEAYSCYNKNEEIRSKSSSGGIFSLIASKILEKNGVVFGASFNEKFMVEHIYIEKEEELYKLRGSKYLQSEIGDSYKQVKTFLEEGRYVLFTGTPCQIEGLISYLNENYENLITQDIICHGVPSPKVWKKYLEYREKEDGATPLEINFRSKENGWKNYKLKFRYKDYEYKNNQNTDKYMQAFLKNASLRKSCYNCSFKKINRVSDITLADFWGIENVSPKMFDNKGTSLVIINSEKGKKLFNEIQDEVIKEKTNLNEAIKYNPSMIMSSKADKNREEFFKNLDNMNFNELVDKYTEKPNLIQKCILKGKKIVKNILKKQ